ncbi:hypothetical protein TKK_0016920 [Trichogramma kaykai]|uniref:Iron-binding zinc finger CDGSH type domain-containing protein n=1 Tax=Trichogramma kaykai TaxID=54128 RepID=A0ABD2W3W2_9HYME
MTFLELCKALRWSRLSQISYQRANFYSTKTKKKESSMPVNPLKEYYAASFQKENGVVYDKKPFKILCEKGKVYYWCLCGQSKNQPFCDGTHKNIFLKIKHRPVAFTVTETKEYWLCQCKQTNNRPFCDGTHLKEDVVVKRK